MRLRAGARGRNLLLRAVKGWSAGGAFQPDDEFTRTKTLRDLLRNAPQRERLARHAREVLEAHRGATDRTAQLLEKLTAHAA